MRLRHGTRDTNVPLQDARRFASHVPGARLEVLKDADHLGTLLGSIPQVMEDNR